MIRLLSVLFLFASTSLLAQPKKDLTVTAYYSGGPEKLDSFAVEQLTHIIYSFCYLKDNRINVPYARDSATIAKMVSLKQRNPKLKVLLALGGWGGCNTCSSVFAVDTSRKRFASSVKQALDFFGADGIDIDWEFPAMDSYPGQAFSKEDKHNLTLLVQGLRDSLGPKREISIAVGGFRSTLNESIEWVPIMRLVDRINLMTYDFGFSQTGHHTALYSSAGQKVSADNLITYLLKLKVPAQKIVIGAALYARVWDSIPPANNGRYQMGASNGVVRFKDLDDSLPVAAGYQRFWDDSVHAPYIYNPISHRYATYDDERSVKEKVGYAIKNRLNGIMFWQLAFDRSKGGILEAIDQSRKR